MVMFFEFGFWGGVHQGKGTWWCLVIWFWQLVEGGRVVVLVGEILVCSHYGAVICRLVKA